MLAAFGGVECASSPTKGLAERMTQEEIAESEFHHPVSINFGWGFCAIVLQTKKIKGVHENDFIMAAKINEIAAGMGAGE